MKSLLAPLKLERVPNDEFCNFRWVCPNGASCPATVQEVLLYELLQELKEFNDCVTG